MTTATKKKVVALELGKKYEDLYTGYTGIAVIRNTEMNGRTQIALSARVKENGELMKNGWFPPERLRDEKGAEIELPDLPVSQIVLGKQYKDQITEFVGTATSRQDHVDGCVQFGLEGKVDEKTGEAKGYLFDDARLLDPTTGAKGTTSPAPKGPAHIHEIHR